MRVHPLILGTRGMAGLQHRFVSFPMRGASLRGPPCVNGFHGHVGEMRADSVLVPLELRFFAAHSFSPSGGYDS